MFKVVHLLRSLVLDTVHSEHGMEDTEGTETWTGVLESVC